MTSDGASSPRVTVVMPVYNKCSVVRRAVLSVLNQTVPDFEIVIVDDGSTDGSADVIRTFSDRRIRIVEQPNAGEGAARNTGIHASTTDLVAFCDADDEWCPLFLEEVLALAAAYPSCDVYGTSYVLKEPDGATREPVLRAVPTRDWRGALHNYFAVAARSDPPMCSSSVCARKPVLEAIGGFPANVVIGGDLVTWARLAVYYRIAYSARPLASVWLRGAFGAPPNGWPTRIPDRGDPVGQELAQMLGDISPAQVKDFRCFLARWHRMRAEMFVRLDHRSDALRELRRSMHYCQTAPAPYALGVLAVSPQFVRRRALSTFAWAIRRRRRRR